MMNKFIFLTFLLFFSTFSYGSCKYGILQSKTDTKSYNVEFQPENLQAAGKITLSFVEPLPVMQVTKKCFFKVRLIRRFSVLEDLRV